MKKQSAIDMYLQPMLETGTREDIERAKKEYWKEYKKRWKKRKYKECKSFIILLNARELTQVYKAAERCHTAPTCFIKQSALALSGRGSKIDKATVAAVRELFVLHYTIEERHLEDCDVSPSVRCLSLQRLLELENAVLKLLQ
jgi:hypothetical protein